MVLGFRVQVKTGGRPAMAGRHRVHGSGFRVQGSRFRVQGSGFRVYGSGFRAWGHAMLAKKCTCCSKAERFNMNLFIDLIDLIDKVDEYIIDR